jgi:hypothetical protein
LSSLENTKREPPFIGNSLQNTCCVKRPYVGIIQIRFSVEGHTFLSACIQAPVKYSIVGMKITLMYLLLQEVLCAIVMDNARSNT